MHKYDHEKLISELKRIQVKYEGNKDLKACGKLFRDAVTKKKGYIDDDFIRSTLRPRLGRNPELFRELLSILDDSLVKETYSVVYSETFEKQYRIEALSPEEALAALRKKIDKDKTARPSELARTECYVKEVVK